MHIVSDRLLFVQAWTKLIMSVPAIMS